MITYLNKLIVDDIGVDVNCHTFTGKIWTGGAKFIAVKGKFTVEFKDRKPNIAIATPWIAGLKSPNLVDMEDLVDKVSAEYEYKWQTENSYDDDTNETNK